MIILNPIMISCLPTLYDYSLAHMIQVPVMIAINQIRPPQNVQSSANLIFHSTENMSSASSNSIATVSMFSFLSLSRLGLWVFDITTQELTQIYVAPQTLASFAGTEMSFVSLFELSQWILAAIISRPNQFGWLALISLGAVACSTGMYALWVMKHRGHLVHWERIGRSWPCGNTRAS